MWDSLVSIIVTSVFVSKLIKGVPVEIQGPIDLFYSRFEADNP